MKKVLLGVLAVSSILVVIFFFMNKNETPQKQVNADDSTEVESVDKTQFDLRKQSEFVEEVAEKLESKGYSSTGLIMSQDYENGINYIVIISEAENKGKATKKDIQQTFEKVAKSYKLKPFTVQLQEK
ncbi:hypothetical protein [Halobacillus amylolyticus]|uniref:Stage III sporulation protein AH n=1 Tax=Halobacillus amylolyticus TaxID=2932259 RepID=A0ABY4HD56_9BACI|nr:hypothetical protein [Halobacillus amylolyticus]UOR12787.1 hypothetical protein MUO15_04535 [Halobacillus amylolyticus]